MTQARRLRNWFQKLSPATSGDSDQRLTAWPSAVAASTPSTASCCNICGWHGETFTSGYHSEGAQCPHCGSIARDRFLYWCWTQRTAYRKADRVLETSPRLGGKYRARMAQIVTYTCSDYDESAHKGTIRLDLQDVELPDDSVDIVLTPHVLEHVPDTERALSELFRIVAPGGRVVLQIPMPHGVTAPPVEPEYHGDDTLVYWRFGWDLRKKLEAAGFIVDCLVTEELKSRIAQKDFDSGYPGGDVDEIDLLSHADADTLTAVATRSEAQTFGFLPDLMFVTWEARKPA